MDPRTEQIYERIRAKEEQWEQRTSCLRQQTGQSHASNAVLVVGEWPDYPLMEEIFRWYRCRHSLSEQSFVVKFDSCRIPCCTVFHDDVGMGGVLRGHGIQHKEYSPDPERLDSFARLDINLRVLDDIKPDAVVAFPGDRADAHLALIAQASGTKVFWPFRNMWQF